MILYMRNLLSLFEFYFFDILKKYFFFMHILKNQIPKFDSIKNDFIDFGFIEIHPFSHYSNSLYCLLHIMIFYLLKIFKFKKYKKT